MSSIFEDKYCITFSNDLPSSSGLSASFKIVNTDLVHAELIESLTPLRSTLKGRYNSLKTQIANGNVDSALTYNNNTMSAPSELLKGYGDWLDDLDAVVKEIDEKAYNEALFQCREFIDYCKSQMKKYPTSDNYNDDKPQDLWSVDDKMFEGWRLNMLNAMIVSVNLNKYNGFDDMSYNKDETFLDKIRNNNGGNYFGFTQTNSATGNTSFSDSYSFDDFNNVGKDQWKKVEGENNTYTYKNDKGITFKKVTNEDGEVLYYSATGSDNGSSVTKYYTDNGVLIPKSRANRLAGVEEPYNPESHGIDSLAPDTPEWNTYMRNNTTYHNEDLGEPTKLSDNELNWVSMKNNYMNSSTDGSDSNDNNSDNSSSDTGSEKNIGILNNSDFGKAL